MHSQVSTKAYKVRRKCRFLSCCWAQRTFGPVDGGTGFDAGQPMPPQQLDTVVVVAQRLHGGCALCPSRCVAQFVFKSA